MLLPPEPQLAPPLYAGKLSTVLATTPLTVQFEAQPVESVSTLIVSACGGNGGGGEGGGGEGGGMGAIFAHVTPPIRLPLPTQVDCFGQLPVGLLYAYEYEKRWQMPFQYPKKA